MTSALDESRDGRRDRLDGSAEIAQDHLGVPQNVRGKGKKRADRLGGGPPIR